MTTVREQIAAIEAALEKGHKGGVADWIDYNAKIATHAPALIATIKTLEAALKSIEADGTRLISQFEPPTDKQWADAFDRADKAARAVLASLEKEQ